MAERNELPQQLPANLRTQINHVGRYDLTPLLWSVKDDNVTPTTVGILVGNGGDEFYYSKTLLTSSILHSLNYGPFNEFAAIVRNSRDINRYQGDTQRGQPTILFSAVVHGDVSKVELLLHSGANIEVRNHVGETPLLHTLPGNLSTIMALLKAGADPTVRDNYGNGICETLSHANHPARQKELAAVRKQLAVEGVDCGPSDSSQ
jgi:ankyrin repeat protein